MRSSKFYKIADSIHQLMLMNKIDAGIMNAATAKITEDYQNEKCFIYMEICNTSPMISSVFNSDEMLIIGRDVSKSAICIQDETVSRIHAQLVVENDYLYIRNCSKSQSVGIGKRFRRTNLSTGEYSCLYHSDCVFIGPAKMRFWLFKGKERIIN